MDAAIDRLISPSELEVALRKAFDCSELKVRACFSEYQNERICVVSEQRLDGFTSLSFQRFVIEDEECYLFAIFSLSKSLDAMIVTVSETYAKESPYSDLVFKEGKVFLADDINCDAGNDWDWNNLKIERELCPTELPEQLQKFFTGKFQQDDSLNSRPRRS